MSHRERGILRAGSDDHRDVFANEMRDAFLALIVG
jgi:hypothetical protein